MNAKRLVPLALAALLLTPAVTQAQTEGTLVVRNPYNETWTITIAASDSVSTYFKIPSFATDIRIQFPALTAGGIAFEAAIDSSNVSGQESNSVFRQIKTKAAVLDSIASTTGNFCFDATALLSGYRAVRVEVGPNSTVAQAAARTIRVYIRRTPPR